MNRQLDFLFRLPRMGNQHDTILNVGSQAVPIHFVRSCRARRYIIRVDPDGSIRATVPRRGSIKGARAFAEQNLDWIVKQIEKRRDPPSHSRNWQPGTEILYRGEKVQLIVSPKHDGNVVQFADQVVPVSAAARIRPVIERHFWRLARAELTARTLELAVQHGLAVKKVIVCNQQSRWGSCSKRGTISLNWRLILMMEFVRDYIITHELMHLREMNHSRRFWRLVEEACPNYKEAKLWIKKHRGMLR